jgi:FkbM family methyltransferase
MKSRLRRMLVTSVLRLGPANPVLRWYLAKSLRPANVTIRFTGSLIELRRGGHTIRLRASHFPFVPEVSRAFDSYFSTLQANNGVLDFSAPGVQRYIPSGLEFFLTSLPEDIADIDSYFIVASPSPGSLVFDIGANCGVTTHRLASLVGPAGRVIAFEPDPENHAALLDNIRRHKLTNVTPVAKGIAPTTGQYSFNSEGTLGAGLSSFIARPTLGQTRTIDCLSLADAVKEFGAPAFVKMDLEGAELAVLRGNSETLKKYRCPYVLDTGHVVDGVFDTSERTESIFRECGYKAGTLREDGGGDYVTTWAVPQ